MSNHNTILNKNERSLLKAVALQTARNGSKGVVNKNTMLVDELPLFLHNLRNLQKSELVSRTYFSTDIPQAEDFKDKYDYTIINRPPELCTSSCSHYDAMLHGVRKIQEEYDFEYLVITLGNSYGALPDDIDNAIRFLDDNLGYDSCQSVAQHNWHTPIRACTISDDKLIPFINPSEVLENSNDRKVFGDTYFFNGSFFVVRIQAFHKNEGFPFTWAGKTVKPIVQNSRYMELDHNWQKTIFDA